MVSKHGAFGGKGDTAFDGGSSGVIKLTAYYQENLLSGIKVEYRNGNSLVHGKAAGTPTEIDLSNGITITVGQDTRFTSDAANIGVVAVGPSHSEKPPMLPLGFFGTTTDRIYSLGFYA